MKEFVRISDVNAIIDDRIKRIKDSGRTRLTPAELNLNIVRKMINDLDMADVVVRKKGKWLQLGKCSECGGSAPFWSMASTYYESDFCPHCGADMRGVNNG